MMLDNTFFETRLAVGPLGYSFGYGSVRPTEGGQYYVVLNMNCHLLVTAMGIIMNKSM